MAPQILRPKPERQHFLQGTLQAPAPAVRQNDLKGFRIAEFHHDLPADTTGSTQFVGIAALRAAHHRDFRKFPLPFVNRPEKGRPLRTVCGRVCSIFDIAAVIYFTTLCHKRSTYLKMRMRRVCMFPGFFRLQDQFFVGHFSSLPRHCTFLCISTFPINCLNTQPRHPSV